MSQVRTPKFTIKYNGKDITSDLTPYLTDVEYTDKVIGESDEISITLEDSEGLWRNEWWPSKGDKIDLDFGYDDLVTDAGTFTVDEIEISGPPDIVRIRGLASWVTTAMRTKESKAYEGQTLKDIAQSVASKHGLTLEGKIATMRIARSTQHQETDLEYLTRLANEFGYQFTIKGTKLVFWSVFELEKGTPVVEISRGDIASYSMKDKAFDSYAEANVKYHDPKEKKLVSFNVKDVQSAGGENFNDKSSADKLEIRVKAENQQQAEQIGKSQLYRKRANQIDGSISLEGNPILVAGNNFDLLDMGALSGRYHITESRHRISKSGGYETSIQIKRVGYVVKTKHKANKTPRKTRYDVSVVYPLNSLHLTRDAKIRNSK